MVVVVQELVLIELRLGLWKPAWLLWRPATAAVCALLACQPQPQLLPIAAAVVVVPDCQCVMACRE